jgi:xanthine dehydrogenase accessory factor
VRLDLLSALNAERTARRACVLVTALASGNQRLVKADMATDDPLAVHILPTLANGKSGQVIADGEKWFLNVQVPPRRVIVTGAVHISQAMVPMAKLIGLDIAILDPRSAFATPERFADVTLIADWPDVALPQLGGLDRFTALVALTHDPKIDDPALVAALRANCFYIGALGSRKTHAARLARLGAAGFAESELAAIHAPIGLDIGAVSPAEIALAILGEIIAARSAASTP